MKEDISMLAALTFAKSRDSIPKQHRFSKVFCFPKGMRLNSKLSAT